MSTRSGKRIHNSFQENIFKPDLEQVPESVKKPRSRRLKENVEECSVSLIKNKKRANYVTYPTDDEAGLDTVDSKEEESKPVRCLRKNTLIEQNLIISTKNDEPPTGVTKVVRRTRRTFKLPDDAQGDTQVNPNHSEEETDQEQTKKSRQEKKKKQSVLETTEEIVISKKKTKKKKGKKTRKTGSLVVEDIKPQNDKNNSLNKSNMSVDSFHSAAGSPEHILEDGAPSEIVKSPEKNLEIVNTTYEKAEGRKTRSSSRHCSFNMLLNASSSTVKESRKRKSSGKDLYRPSINMFEPEPEMEGPVNLFSKVTKKRKSSFIDTVSDDMNTEMVIVKEIKNSTYNLEDLEEESVKSSAVDRESSRLEKSTISDVMTNSNEINTTYDKEDISKTKTLTDTDITTIDKSGLCDDKITKNEKAVETVVTKNNTHQSVINTTYENSVDGTQFDIVTDTITQTPRIINTTYEKDSGSNILELSGATSSKNATFDKELPKEIHSPTNNKILRKSLLSVTSQKLSTEMNSTYDKTEKSNSTFDKVKSLDGTFDKSRKSSLISSDNSNITTDKSDMSQISITSDDSSENIVNTTPVLIESSLDESIMTTSAHCPKSPAQVPLTPLKREGTFTKESPEVVLSTPPLSKTPIKHTLPSVPSPGCTPFPVIKSNSNDKSMLNVTRSIERNRRSSLTEPLARTTKVMFCSPVNDPTVVLQQRRKVIKSNLKGSNKSFVLEENEVRPAARKRSYTQSDAEDARAKRKRLADGIQHSVERLSRPRTASASAKVPEPSTPSKRPVTPKKSDAKISRTKLPNFAALHQKEFAKMESLDECQERKAKRAKQLLTPTGAITVLERSSPRETATAPQISPNEPKEEQKEIKNDKRSKQLKKPVTPVKSLPTLKSLNPGYSRFGFKLNLDVNPFSVPKTDAKNQSVFSFSSQKDTRAKTKLFTFSSKKNTKDNTKPLKEIRSNLVRQATLPSLAGTTSARKEAAKQTVMREKSFTDRRNVNRNENRTVIKGVRTNRRFELQMRMRNID